MAARYRWPLPPEEIRRDADPAELVSQSPPEEIRIGSFVLRPCGQADARLYTAAQLVSHDHLAQFEGWAQPLPTVEGSQARIEWSRQVWDSGRGYFYCTYDAETEELVGSVGMHAADGQKRALEIGYWTVEAHTMRGAATLGAVALTAAAFGLDRVVIQCDVNNIVSARIPRRLGYQVNETRPRPVTAPGEAGVVMLHICDRRWYPKTYAHRMWVEERL